MSIAIKDILQPEEIRHLTARSDLRGALYIIQTWLLISAIFALLILLPNPLTFILAVFLLGGQQLACAVIAHEATHRTLFKTRWLNDSPADWLCARPIWLDVRRYREHHIKHHKYTGVDGDPDLSLVDPFPCSRKSLHRKFVRDLLGLSGLRRIVGLLGMDFGILRYTVAAEVERLPKNNRQWYHYAITGINNLLPVILTNAVIAGLLAMAGAAWAYSAWVIAYLTTFSLYLRIRSIAEHACTEKTEDFLRNTRSTRAGLLARLTVAPMSVNYHIEHHLMASAPFYRLPELHKLLQARNLVQAAPGYSEVLRTASAAGES